MNKENRADIENIVAVVRMEHEKWRQVGRTPEVSDYANAIEEWLEDGNTPEDTMRNIAKILELEMPEDKPINFSGK